MHPADPSTIRRGRTPRLSLTGPSPSEWQVVPEETRATIYNIYRVPLNMIVLVVLLNHISTLTAFSCCASMLLVAFYLQRVLAARIAARSKRALGGATSDEEHGNAKTGLMSDSY